MEQDWVERLASKVRTEDDEKRRQDEWPEKARAITATKGREMWNAIIDRVESDAVRLNEIGRPELKTHLRRTPDGLTIHNRIFPHVTLRATWDSRASHVSVKMQTRRRQDGPDDIKPDLITFIPDVNNHDELKVSILSDDVFTVEDASERILKKICGLC